MHRLALSLGLADCAQACLGTLCTLNPAELTTERAIQLAYSTQHPDSPITQELRRLATAAVLQCLGDIVTAMRREGLKAQWLSLPHAVVHDLLHSEQLATDSEDSVLSAVTVWADANQPSERQAQMLLEQVRLQQLSSPFFYTILPLLVLQQIVGSVDAWELMQVACYAKADILHATKGTAAACLGTVHTAAAAAAADLCSCPSRRVRAERDLPYTYHQFNLHARAASGAYRSCGCAEQQCVLGSDSRCPCFSNGVREAKANVADAV